MRGVGSSRCCIAQDPAQQFRCHGSTDGVSHVPVVFNSREDRWLGPGSRVEDRDLPVCSRRWSAWTCPRGVWVGTCCIVGLNGRGIGRITSSSEEDVSFGCTCRHRFAHHPLHLQHGFRGHSRMQEVSFGSSILFSKIVQGAFHDVWGCLYESFHIESQFALFFVGLESFQGHGSRFWSVALGVIGDDVFFAHFAGAQQEHGEESRPILSGGAEEEQSSFPSKGAFHDAERVSEFSWVCFEEHFVEQRESTSVDTVCEQFFFRGFVPRDPMPRRTDQFRAIHPLQECFSDAFFVSHGLDVDVLEPFPEGMLFLCTTS